MDITVIVPIIIAILSPGVWIAIIQHNKTKAEAKKADSESNKADAEAKKIEAETAEIIQRITAEQLAMSEKRMDEKELECKQRIDELEKDNKSIKAQLIVIKRDMKNILDHYIACVEGAHLLVSQVARHKEEPCYTPPPLEIVKKRKLAFKDEQ